MPLDPGTRFGPYEVTALIGRGGMGEVYRARDTSLNRDVALKVLPETLVADPDRLMRFEREAQTLATLNHPNIAQIYAVERFAPTQTEGTQTAGVVPPSGREEVRPPGQALVLEYVAGEDLAVRIARGPLPLDEALGIARQVAEALEAAHEAGIVHRDLKPANIKIKADGTVKVLDFGLAKAAQGDGPGSRQTGPSPSVATMTSPAVTELGVILGTAAYMSPEQARGRPVDKRADIWAFGAVLLEMLTGRSAFGGDTMSDVIAAVLTRDPDWDLLPASTPSSVRRLLARCLERDPRRRLRDIGDARLELETAGEPETAAVDDRPPARPGARWLPWAVAALGTAVALWAVSTRDATDSALLDGHFTIELPDEAALVTYDEPGWNRAPLAVAPDGRQVVYVAPTGRGTQLFSRAMADLTPRLLPGTEGARLPFFSPDGLWVGFFADGKLKKTPLAGGTPVTLADAPDGLGGSWTPGGEILFAPTYSSGLFAVPDAGGDPRRVTSLDSASGDDLHGWPQVLPGGRLVLFTVWAWSRETAEIVTLDLESGERRLVLADASFARYVSGRGRATAGHLVFVREGSLMAAPFDPDGSEPAGTPIAVVEGVTIGQFDISASGVLAYVPGSSAAPDFSLVWVDRTGVSRPINDLPRGYEDLHLSPDGRQVAVTVEERGPESPAHVWLADTERGTLTRLTFEGFSRDPVFAPDGQSVVFGSKRGDGVFGLYLQRLDGRSPAELIWASPTPIWPDPQSWTPDGLTVVFTTKGDETSDDIWTLSLEDGSARPWLETPAAEWAGRLSPDGRWMAYASSESGREEVYVLPFPEPGAKRLISDGGGTNPIWSRDGREIFYRAGDQVLAVEVETDSGFSAGKPVPMFSGRYRLTGRDFDVSPDGTRFVMMQNDDPRTTGRFRVVLDWWRVLDARLGGSLR